ncbi:MAG: hypothetical protein EXX96DRAFT_4808 [Benjaminiella poitrasii]|nr:MAG: hypothetical protein EXX96DRAFT_4808 [Benjaminiella poitrasii]
MRLIYLPIIFCRLPSHGWTIWMPIIRALSLLVFSLIYLLFIGDLPALTLTIFFVSRDLSTPCLSTTSTYIHPAWSDHMLLSLYLRLDPPLADGQSSSALSSLVKGIWRAHPSLASSKAFCRQLNDVLSAAVAAFPSHMSAQFKWDAIKQVVKRVAQSYSRKQAFSLSAAETLLQRKRSAISSRILQDPTLGSGLSPQLQVVEHQLSSIQRHRVDNLALHSGLRWRERGESSTGYLKRTVNQRQQKTLFRAVRRPRSSVLCTS